MAVIGCCCKLLAILIALAATTIGLLNSGVISKYTPFFVWIDTLELPRGTYFKGLIPAMHRDVPWGFTHEELSEIKLKDHVVVVTGANVGLGYWSAWNIATTDATVVIACRSTKKCQAAADTIEKETKKKVIPMELDLSSFESVRAFAKAFKSKFKHLDSLLLNAGVMAPPFTKSKDGIEIMMAVNHFGHFLLTEELLPLLEAGAKKHGVATITSVSSAAHYDSYPEGIFDSLAAMNDESKYSRVLGYGQSKLANVLFAQELAERYASKNILANSVHPGAVETELAKHMIDAVSSFVGPDAAEQLRAFINSGMWSPKDASLTQVYTSIGPKLKEQKITGKYFHPIARLNGPHKHASNKSMQKNLWKLSEEVIKSH